VASMLTELFQRYLSLLGADVPPLAPPPTIAFRDFVALEQKAIKSEAHRRYWAEKLEDCIVTTIPRWPAVGRMEGSRQVLSHNVPLSAELSDGLKQLAQSEGLPLKSILLAAHLWVLSRFSGQSDILTGLLSHGRPEEADGERVLGLFLNTLPFRLELSGGTWLDLIQCTWQAEQEMLPFRLYPLVELQQIQGGQTLFETAFNFIHFHIYQTLGEFTDIQLLDGGLYEETNFALGAVFSQGISSPQVNLALQYDTTILCQEQVEIIGGYYARALAAIVDKPLDQYTTCALLSEAEQQQLLVKWNATQVDYPVDRCIHEIFEGWAQCNPDAVAVVYKDQHLTHQELNGWANRLAHYLQAQGIGPDCLVGIYIERSLQMMVGILGVLKAGGAYVPLDPTYPQERVAFIQADTKPLVLLTRTYLLDGLSEHEAQVVCLDSDWENISQEASKNPISGVRADNLAYVIYTSGSTGKPKGILVPHRGLPNVVEAMIRTFELTPNDRVLQFSSPSFDASVYDILLALGSGATLCLAQETLLPDLSLARWLQDVGVTIIPLTASALAALADNDLSSLRIVISGAEACPADLVARWSRGSRFFNVYGPTEATIWATVAECTDGSLKPTIGHPIANAQVYLLDKHLRPVPVCVTGEMCIGGVGLTRGYLNSPRLTAEKFIPNPFSKQPGVRLYRTGDLARCLPDGKIDFLGRLDHQVKVRGFRIELGEIETVLRQHSAVQETVVVARQTEQTPEINGGPKTSRLTAYVVLQEGQTFTVSELRRFLRTKLPEYMVPAVFVTLEELPLSPNGKVDRRALPAPDAARPKLDKEFVAPRTPIEKETSEIWAEVLDLEKVGIYDHFFIDLGGHSLLALQIIAKLNETFQVDLPLRDLFEADTVADLTLRIVQQRASRTDDATLDKLLRDIEYQEGQALTPAQLKGAQPQEQSRLLPGLLDRIAALSPEQREFLLQQLQAYQEKDLCLDATLPVLVPDPEKRFHPFPMTIVQQVYWIGRSGLYDMGNCGSNIYMEFQVTGIPNRFQPVIIKRLESALDRLIARHDMLRMVVLADGWQQILPQVPQYKIPVLNLRGRSVSAIEAELEKVRRRMSTDKAPIDRWPLFDILAHQLDNKRLQLHFRIDALLMDGTSRGQFINELFQLVQNPGLACPSLECTFRDYALAWTNWQNKENELYRRSQEYWMNRLSTLPPAPDLPLIQDLSSKISCRHLSWKTKLLEPKAWQQLKKQATQAGLTPSGIVAAAYIETLIPWCSRPSFTIGLISTYRPILHLQMAEIIGNFNTISLLAVDNLPETFKDRAKHLQQQIATDLQYRDFSGHQVLRELNRHRGPSSKITIPFFFNSVIEYNHPSYRVKVSSGQDEPISPSPRGPLLARLRNLLKYLGGKAVESVTNLYLRDANTPPQIQVVEAVLCAPQILLLPTLSEDGEGVLWCQWQMADGVFPAGFVEYIADIYTQTLRRLANEEEIWYSTPPFFSVPLDRFSQAMPKDKPAPLPKAALQKTCVAPRNNLELELKGIWEDVLGKNTIGVTDSFFDLGGDSFSVVCLMTRIQQDFDPGFLPPFATFFQEPTIQHLAHIIREGRQDEMA
jgi:amino acid adenylation domain-containing protein